MQLFSFWRSLASFRADRAQPQAGAGRNRVRRHRCRRASCRRYRKINPQMALPALVTDDGTVLFQSLAIIDYLDETYPDPPLLPADALGRARGARAGADRCLRGPSAADAGAPLSRPRARSARQPAECLAAALDGGDAGGARGPPRRPQGDRPVLPAKRRPWPTSAWSATSRRRSTSRSACRPGRP